MTAYLVWPHDFTKYDQQPVANVLLSAQVRLDAAISQLVKVGRRDSQEQVQAGRVRFTSQAVGAAELVYKKLWSAYLDLQRISQAHSIKEVCAILEQAVELMESAEFLLIQWATRTQHTRETYRLILALVETIIGIRRVAERASAAMRTSIRRNIMAQRKGNLLQPVTIPPDEDAVPDPQLGKGQYEKAPLSQGAIEQIAQEKQQMEHTIYMLGRVQQHLTRSYYAATVAYNRLHHGRAQEAPSKLAEAAQFAKAAARTMQNVPLVRARVGQVAKAAAYLETARTYLEKGEYFQGALGHVIEGKIAIDQVVKIVLALKRRMEQKYAMLGPRDPYRPAG